jgi:hypothetical protein
VTTAEDCQSNRSTRVDSFEWAVGLFEGEGHIGVFLSKRDGYSRMQVGLATTDGDIAERFQRAVGVGKVYGPYKKKSPRKPIWQWVCFREEEVRSLVERMLPLLGERRAEAARKLLAEPSKSRKKTHCSKGHEMSGDNLRIISTTGKRRCRQCQREKDQKRRST